MKNLTKDDKFEAKDIYYINFVLYYIINIYVSLELNKTCLLSFSKHHESSN